VHARRLLLTVKERIADAKWFEEGRPAEQRADWSRVAPAPKPANGAAVVTLD